MVDMEVITKREEEDRESVHESKTLQAKTEGEGEQLLPGIPNEITLDQVALKLPWVAFFVLSAVSRGWRRAIQSRQVYDARVCSQSTETLLALVRYQRAAGRKLALYSVKDGSSYCLPEIPRTPWQCELASLDGKLYVLGGLKSDRTCQGSGDEYNCAGVGDVYMLDLAAGQREWKQCASMRYPRTRFGCGVINEKIYVFGGSSGPLPVCGLEVYDPKQDAWSPVLPMQFFRFDHKVITVGEELFAHNGLRYEKDIFQWAGNRVIDPYDSDMFDELFYHYRNMDSAEVYHPLKDEWRCVEDFDQNREPVLMVGGKLHKVTPLSIHVYDVDANTWKLSQSFSFDAIEPRHSFSIKLTTVLAVDDELYARTEWRILHKAYRGAPFDIYHLRSEGLGGENRELVWHKAKGPLSSEFFYHAIMCLIQL